MTNELKKAINRMFKYDGDMDMTKEGINECSITIQGAEGFKFEKARTTYSGVDNPLERLYILLTNPIYYLFKGKWRI